MSLQERVPCRYRLVNQSRSGHDGTEHSSIVLCSEDSTLPSPFKFTFQTIRDNVFRLCFASDTHPLPPCPSVKQPHVILVETPKIDLRLDRQTKVIKTGKVEALIEWSNTPLVSLKLAGDQEPIYQDLPFRSYVVDGVGIAHYSRYKKHTLHVGLGEKAAPMDLSGRQFAIAASDTFGYDAYRTDPLYKHIPLLINITRHGCVGIFSTAHTRATWSVGSEIDGLWGHFKVYKQAYGGLEEYLIVGKTVEEVVRTYADIASFPLLVPRYMMGYIGGGMKYSMQDEPRAADAILQFLSECKEKDIPISAFQMSSGYTVAETEPKTRNVFTWNRRRFPDPRVFTRECHRQGVRLLANIKPYVLASHPEYRRLVEAGALFYDPVTKSSAVARLWSAGGGESGEGGHIDFTSKAGFEWWYRGCRALKEVGVDAMWNDNNEYNIPSDDWVCALETVVAREAQGDSERRVGFWGRALQTELMARSSHNACVDHAPDERPVVLTRSATAGTMRYASCSWGGDNVTSWESMKGGNALALNAGFSLLQCYGHDIGGFEGPQPSPELLVRWVQLGIHSPRFAINCYKTSADDNLVGEVIEPWMYPSITPIIRAAIKRRYELIPYTYSLSLNSHLTAVPPQRWTGWGHEADPEVWSKEITNGETQYWFGDALLVAGVYEPGKTSTRVYLPVKTAPSTDWGFLNTNAPYQHLPSGQWHIITSAWYDSIPVLAKCGTAVPVGKNRVTTCCQDEEGFPDMEKDDWRGVEIFPPPRLYRGHGDAPSIPNGSTTFENSWMEDDGISAQSKLDICTIRVSYTISGLPEDGITVEVVVEKTKSWEPLWLTHGLDVILPVGDERSVRSTKVCTIIREKSRDIRGRRVWNVSLPKAT